MTIEIKPETERLMREELSAGPIHDIDNLIAEGVQALRERRNQGQTGSIATRLSRSRAEAVDRILELRKGNRLPPGVTIKDLLNEGCD